MNRKSVLVVSEQFTKGGLETHIINQVTELGQNVEFVFSFGKYEPNAALKHNKVLDIGSFTEEYTVKKFYDQVNKLVEIIEEEKIDIVHVHPFLSLLPVVFAGILAGKPVIYTLHGSPSLSANSNNFTYSLLHRFFLSYLDQQIITVRKDLLDVGRAYGIENFHYIPNSSRTVKRGSVKRSSNNKWALLARLDNESQTAIFNLIDHIDIYGLDTIDIYGNGWAETIIKNRIEERGLTDRVRLCGWSNGAVGALQRGDYEGVIGHGQVAVEGLALGFPVLLLSYGRVSGLIDKDLYDKIKEHNFINIYLQDTQHKDIAKQLQDYRKNQKDYILTEFVVKDFDNSEIQQRYLDVIRNAKYKHSTQLVDAWQRIGALDYSQSPVLDELFLESDTIEEILEECILRYGFVTEPLLLDQIHSNKRYRQARGEQARLSTLASDQQQEITRLSALINDQKQKLEGLAGIKNSSKLLIRNVVRKFK